MTRANDPQELLNRLIDQTTGHSIDLSDLKQRLYKIERRLDNLERAHTWDEGRAGRWKH